MQSVPWGFNHGGGERAGRGERLYFGLSGGEVSRRGGGVRGVRGGELQGGGWNGAELHGLRGGHLSEGRGAGGMHRVPFRNPSAFLKPAHIPPNLTSKSSTPHPSTLNPQPSNPQPNTPKR